MENEGQQSAESTGEMRSRRETMPDGKRYIIYYTFGDEEKAAPQNEVNRNV